MKITTGIPKRGLLTLEEDKKIPVINNFKRNNRYRSCVDTECSSINSKKEADFSQSHCETIEENNYNIKHYHVNMKNFNTANPRDINTFSTIDSNRDNDIGNAFKRKVRTKHNKNVSNLNKDIAYLIQERSLLLSRNSKELKDIKLNSQEITKKKIDEQYQIYLNKKEIIKEEHIIVKDNFREEIKFLEDKIKLREDENILRSEHERVRENLLFHFEMKKKILNEKMKYYKTLIKEKNELRSISYTNKTLLSYMDINNFQYNDSSLYESTHLAFDNNLYISKPLFRHSEAFDVQSSVVLKEDNLIGDINAIKPKFFSTFN